MGDYTDQKTPTNYAVLRTEIVEVTKEKNELSIARDVVNKMPECNLRISLQNRLDTVDINLNEDVNKNFEKIYSSRNATFGIKDDGTLWAWGGNSCGELGTGDYFNRSKAVQVKGLENIVDVYTSPYSWHVFAKNLNGEIFAWGNNQDTQLGIPGADGRLHTPTKLTFFADNEIKDIKTGAYHTIFLKVDGSVWGVGSSWEYQLGLGEDIYRTDIPMQIIDNVKTISTGRRHSIVIKNDGTVWAWGRKLLWLFR